MKYIFFFKRFLYYLYGEKFYKRLPYDWSKHPSRIEIIQEIINQKKFQNYLEIGCDQDENFSQIEIKKKLALIQNVEEPIE
tara:strand:+ start:92 stop:334 length:243 start_codon:yes stop_codon:yes gene_type:complete